jgi:hypothetical protein
MPTSIRLYTCGYTIQLSIINNPMFEQIMKDYEKAKKPLEKQDGTFNPINIRVTS